MSVEDGTDAKETVSAVVISDDELGVVPIACGICACNCIIARRNRSILSCDVVIPVFDIRLPGHP